MFKNRKITVTLDKKTEGDDLETPVSPEEFEQKTEFVLKKLNTLGTHIFAGICVYVLLDTYRQVKVAKASKPEYKF